MNLRRLLAGPGYFFHRLQVSAALGRIFRNAVLRNILAYTFAIAIVWWIARDVPLHRLLGAFADANLWVFIPVSLIGIAVWFVDETVLWSKLFSYFLTKTTFRELLPANAAQYFLQVINFAASAGALALFLNRDKGVAMLDASGTLLFMFFLDGIVLAAMAAGAGLLVPTSPMRAGLWWAIGAEIFFLAIAAFWLNGHPFTRVGRWLHERAWLRAFRDARPHQYLVLMAIRGAVFMFNGLILYAQLWSFGVHVSLGQAMAFNPAVILFGATPVTPVGVGSLQAMMVYGFSRFGTRHQLLALSLAMNAMQFAFRIPLGFVAAGKFTREVTVEAHPTGAARKEPRETRRESGWEKSPADQHG